MFHFMFHMLCAEIFLNSELIWAKVVTHAVATLFMLDGKIKVLTQLSVYQIIWMLFPLIGCAECPEKFPLCSKSPIWICVGCFCFFFNGKIDPFTLPISVQNSSAFWNRALKLVKYFHPSSDFHPLFTSVQQLSLFHSVLVCHAVSWHVISLCCCCPTFPRGWVNLSC